MAEIFIIKPEQTAGVKKDIGVPDQGERYVEAQLRRPKPRGVAPQNYFDSTARSLLRLAAVKRVNYFGHGHGSEPYVHFPIAEHTEDAPFTRLHWEFNENLESEIGRVKFMMDHYPTRLFPASFDGIGRDILRDGHLVLGKWGSEYSKIATIGAQVYDQLGNAMANSKTPDDANYNNGKRGTYKSDPQFYDVSEYTKQIEEKLWRLGVEQMATELGVGDFTHVKPFLELYATVKDPLTQPFSLEKQVTEFKNLHARSKLLGTGHDPRNAEALVVQLALESQWLTLPGVGQMDVVRTAGHHELPYTHVDVAKLPRGEFADPGRINATMTELIQDSVEYRHTVATPLTVAYFKEPHKTNARLFIVDGNNRATSILLMKLADSVGFDKCALRNPESLRKFVDERKLDIEWERDLSVALEALPPETVDLLVDNQPIVRSFARGRVPALLVQESSFHTMEVKEGSDTISLLHPGHQGVYNSERWSIAIPSKKQSHGRAAENNIRMEVIGDYDHS